MSDPYLTLIASLPPHLPNLFTTRQTPISRIKLDERLKLLEPNDAETLTYIENLVHWDRISMDTSDLDMLKRGFRQEANLKNKFIGDIIRWRMEQRTFVAALRRRYLGQSAPLNTGKWGYGRWMKRIEQHWQEPAFGLENHYPWLLQAERFLQEKKYLAMERLLLKRVWDHYGRVVGEHYFDFEAVVIYVLRWNVIERWSRYNGMDAIKCFNEMADTALDQYGVLFRATHNK